MSAARLVLQHLHDRRTGFDPEQYFGRSETTTFLAPDTGVGRQVGDLWIPPAKSVASRPMPLKSEGSCRGSLVSANDNRGLVFESTLEYGVAVMLLARRDVAQVIDQPDPVAYRDEARKLHHHTFDFLVHMLDGTRVAIAVKPEARVKASGIEATIALIRAQVGARFADRYVIRSERHIPRNRVENAELILRARRCHNEADVSAMAKLAADLHGTTTIAELVLASGRQALGDNPRLLRRSPTPPLRAAQHLAARAALLNDWQISGNDPCSAFP